MVEFMAIYLLKPAPADGGTGKAEVVVCPYPCSTDPFPLGRCFYMPLWPRWMGRAPKGGYTPVRIRLAAPMGEPGTADTGRAGLGILEREAVTDD